MLAILQLILYSLGSQCVLCLCRLHGRRYVRLTGGQQLDTKCIIEHSHKIHF